MMIGKNTTITLSVGFICTCASLAIGWFALSSHNTIDCQTINECVECTEVAACVDGQELVKAKDYLEDKRNFVVRNEFQMLRDEQKNNFSEVNQQLREIRRLVLRMEDN